MTTAWLFPGQGTQHVGMGRSLCASSAAARRVFDEADSALGWSLSKLCFEGPEEELTRTANAQPAIVTASIAALAALEEAIPNLPRPAFAAGHSLGEYSALVAAGALGFADAVRLVHLRGRAMQQAVPEGDGGMAAIMGGDAEAVQALCREAAEGDVLSPANYNAPGQIVIAGSSAAVARASRMAPDRKLKAILLKVSAPFHCSLMAPAAEAVRAALASVRIEPPAFPVVSNVEAAPNAERDKIAALLVRQIAAPVLWEQTIRSMADAGVDTALEIGPGKVLAGLCRRIDKRITVTSLGDSETISAFAGAG